MAQTEYIFDNRYSWGISCMKLNGVERLVVNSPLRRAAQYLEVMWFKRRSPLTAGSKILEIGCGRGAGARLINQKFKPDLKEVLLDEGLDLAHTFEVKNMGILGIGIKD